MTSMSLPQKQRRFLLLLSRLEVQVSINQKTMIYKNQDIDSCLESLPQVPYYKTLLIKYQNLYEKSHKDENVKGLVVKHMKDVYGFPGNTDDYFYVNPRDKKGQYPKTLKLETALMLIVFFNMTRDDANHFLESCGHCNLNSRFAPQLTKLIGWLMERESSLESINAVVLKNLGVPLFPKLSISGTKE